MQPIRLAATVGAMLTLVLPAFAGTVQIEPQKDTTLYESPSGTVGNGAGQHLFAGRTGQPKIRRALLAFDIAGNIPAGAEITSVALTLHMSKTNSGRSEIFLHRMLADWGEGAADANGDEGKGTGAMPGDATWVHTFYDTDFWPDFTFGGLYSRGASAVTTVSSLGYSTWQTTPSLVDDVQSWLDDSRNNFGWIVVGDEIMAGSAKRFDSRDHPDAAVRPMLVVEFEEAAAPAPVCSIACDAASECEGTSTTVALAASATPSDAALAWAWDGPCLFADTGSPYTTADCPGVGEFPLALTVALDANGNGIVDDDEPSSACETLAVVQDSTAPELTVPGSLVLECAGGAAATVDLAATAQDACSDVAISNSMDGATPDAAGPLGLGEHTIAWKASDSSGNLAAGWTAVTVVDLTPPYAECIAIDPSATPAPPPWGGMDDEGDDEGDDEDGDDNGPSTTVALGVETGDACCLAATEAVLDIGCLRLSVVDGETIELTCLDAFAAGCDASITADGTLQIRSTTAVLHGTAIDCSGNTDECSVELCSPGTPPPPLGGAATGTDDDPTPSAGSRTRAQAPSRRGALRRR